ncbi:MAG: uroporphyrinogen decarboxylase [Pseudomonadota bacterium]
MGSPTKTLLRVLAGEALATPPVWLMRQAGRYLPEYRATRAEAGSFLDLCYTPHLAEEVTLQPIRRYGFDASILFADILLLPQALGMELRFVEGEGPRMDWPAGHERDLAVLKTVAEIDATLNPVYETVRRLAASLPAETTLIGFAGAPWTVATYMAAGRGTPDQAPARHWAHSAPESFDRLIGLLTEATIHYLSKQIEAGAEVVMLFDSWAGSLIPPLFHRHAIAPAARIAEALAAKHPGIPMIGFPKGAGAMYEPYALEVPCAGMALDQHMPIPFARRVANGKALMGNLDPMMMVLGGDTLRAEAHRILEEMDGHPHIFNLGHGITPDADPEHVHQLLKAIRG